jgi:hypothetical protein
MVNQYLLEDPNTVLATGHMEILKQIRVTQTRLGVGFVSIFIFDDDLKMAFGLLEPRETGPVTPVGKIPRIGKNGYDKDVLVAVAATANFATPPKYDMFPIGAGVYVFTLSVKDGNVYTIRHYRDNHLLWCHRNRITDMNNFSWGTMYFDVSQKVHTIVMGSIVDGDENKITVNCIPDEPWNYNPFSKFGKWVQNKAAVPIWDGLFAFTNEREAMQYEPIYQEIERSAQDMQIFPIVNNTYEDYQTVLIRVLRDRFLFVDPNMYLQHELIDTLQRELVETNMSS